MRKVLANKYSLLFFYTILFFSLKTVTNTVGYDTAEFLVSPEGSFRAWIGSGRWALGSLYYLIPFFHTKNLYLLNILTALNTYIFSALFLAFLNYKEEKINYIRDIVCGVLLVSSGYFIEIFYFSLQSVELSFSIIIAVVSVFLAYISMDNERKASLRIPAFLFSVVLLAFSMGTYQALGLVFITGSIVSLIKLNKCDAGIKRNFCSMAISAAIFSFAFIISILMSSAAQNWFGIKNNEYLQIAWGNKSVFQNVKAIIYVVVKTFSGCYCTQNLLLLFVSVLIILHIVRSKDNIFNNSYLALLIICQFQIVYYTAEYGPVRSLLGIPFAVAYAVYYFFDEPLYRRYARKIFVFYAVFQTIIGQLVFLMDYRRYVNDVQMERRIFADCVKESGQDKPEIFFDGYMRSDKLPMFFRCETIGRSFYEWKRVDSTQQVIQEALYFFFSSQGDDYVFPGEINLKEALVSGPCYPDEGYITFKDNICYVNLSD